MTRGERQARRAPTRVANQVEALETGVVRGPQHAVDLVLERVVRRRLGPGVDLQIPCDRFDLVAQRVEQGTVSESGRHHPARQKDCPRRHSREPTRSLAFGLAPEATPARSGDRPIRPRDQQGQPGMGCSERRHGQGDVRRVRSRGRRGHPRAGDR